ncbi:hydroxypyruvate isomerase-like protein [Leptotrombidium deliense]|uniref:Putative hydroxypyruvate isomerase n=1 Tax=Leptotrombidium deliense TaxID=299467 RepID=A0A443SLM6_9ACAR|nr:hydroxypyruvate isomerase-like protein [Leptotrombidium deliense]
MKFCANLSTLLQDIPSLTDRYIQFCRVPSLVNAIECQNPYLHSIDEWNGVIGKCTKEYKRTPKWILINSPPLFDKCKDIPSNDDFENKVLKQTLEYAKAFNVRKVHLILQDTNDVYEFLQQEPLIVFMPKMEDLLKYAARFMAPHNITCVIEPLSIRPNYYLRSYPLAKEIVRTVNESNLKVMLDTFHLQKLHGNITENIDLIKEVVGHVQISQTPLRDSPMNSGEVDHKYVLNCVSKFYTDYVGLEYNAKSDDTLSWTESFKNV